MLSRLLKHHISKLSKYYNGIIPSKLLKPLIATRRYNGIIELMKEKNTKLWQK
jgi:hypothetical protein